MRNAEFGTGYAMRNAEFGMRNCRSPQAKAASSKARYIMLAFFGKYIMSPKVIQEFDMC